MGKKRVTYDLNQDNKPPNHVTNNHHRHHHHHHRPHIHQKPKKIKPESRLLHTLNSHFKKLAKCRSKKVTSLSSHRASDSLEDNKQHHWFMGHGFDHDDAHDSDEGYMGAFGFDQELCLETLSFLEHVNNEDLFGWEGYVLIGPELSVSHNMVVVFEEDGLGYGSYIPDPVMNEDNNGDEGKYLVDVLELSSQEDMINEFLKVNLFVT
ncbi:hypothetical protein QVD17_06450 [Tagetes erecta]|uniref:Uncharacterized protein n=1 Tax=Tagetes erecta TaxID=13708 RepID=A0AAD8LKN8_TARER|nr:hypothetical protein QVD17_06450 [Tagetes erecta]